MYLGSEMFISGDLKETQSIGIWVGFLVGGIPLSAGRPEKSRTMTQRMVDVSQF